MVLSATFKPNTDDMRDVPSLTIVPALVGGQACVRFVDPQGQREGAAMLPGVSWHENPYEAAQNADLIVILTEWNEFRALDLGNLAKTMATSRMADLRNIYSAKDVKAAGFEAYDSVGREGVGFDLTFLASRLVSCTKLLRNIASAKSQACSETAGIAIYVDEMGRD